MRESNHLPWMGRIMATAVMVLVGLGAFAGSVEAQTTFYPYTNAAAWWNAYDCDAMKVLIPKDLGADTAVGGTGDDADESTANHEKRVCVMWPGLATAERLVIENFLMGNGQPGGQQVVDRGPGNAGFMDHKSWWAAQGTAGTADAANCLVKQRYTATTGLAGSEGALPADMQFKATPATAVDVCDAYDRLRSGALNAVNRAGNALSGTSSSTTTDEDEAPALPLAAHVKSLGTGAER